jgi:hypothetical protein
MKNQNIELQEVMLKIVENYTNLNIEKIKLLVEKTNQYGMGYFKINNYSSDLSKGTENASQLINIGLNYKKAVESDIVTFQNIDLTKIDVNKFDYKYINTDGLSIEKFKIEVKNNLENALVELLQPKKERKSNDIYLNKVLVFNTNTMRLAIVGKSESKTIETVGTFKVVKSKPITVAKELIKKQCSSKTNSMRRFTLDNLVGNVKFNGDTIEIS